MSTPKRILIMAKDFNQAKHYALQKKLSPAYWLFVSSFYNVKMNPELDYVKLEGWDERNGAVEIEAELENSIGNELAA